MPTAWFIYALKRCLCAVFGVYPVPCFGCFVYATIVMRWQHMFEILQIPYKGTDKTINISGKFGQDSAQFHLQYRDIPLKIHLLS